MKRLVLFLLSSVILGNSADVFAGACVNNAGAPTPYTVTYNREFSTTAKNQAGTIDATPQTWGTATTYDVKCTCDGNATTFRDVYYTTVVPLADGSTTGGRHWYSLGNGSNLEVAIRVGMGGNYNGALQDVPLVNFNNNYSQRSDSKNLTCKNHPLGSPSTDLVTGFSTGASGEVTIRIIKPFVGQQNFTAELMSIYGNTASTNQTVPSNALSRVTMSGSVKVSQGCTIGNMNALNVNLGTVNVNDFSSTVVGQKPISASSTPITLTYNCSNMSDGIQLTVSFSGTPDGNVANTLATSDKNVAIRIDDVSGNAISQANGQVKLNFDQAGVPLSGEASATLRLNAYPVVTTQKAPALGTVTALTTLTVGIQ